MRKRLGLIPALLALLALGQPVGAAGPSFEAGFRKAIADQALDRREYEKLHELATQVAEPEEIYLAQGVLERLSQYQSMIQLRFNYSYRQKMQQVNFLFSPIYAEDEVLTGRSPYELLGKLAQQDLLAETRADGFRCGAAAVLAGHYMLYGNFNRALQKLGVSSRSLTYRSLHLAQEKLYQVSNRDGQDGLSQRLQYRVFPDGKVSIVQHDGEVVEAARHIGISIVPLKISIYEELLDRQRVILNLWRSQPKIPLLVGVYLDAKTGKIYPPNEQGLTQNHFVLVFRLGREVWMYNSGVSDNGLQAAITPLDSDEIRAYVMQTEGSVNALYRYP